MAMLSAKQRSALGRKAAKARWGKHHAPRTDFEITTPEAADRREATYWRSRPAEECFLAVEAIREASFALYNNRKLPRLERVYRFIDTA
jgi:hypothetical protein